MAQQGYLARNGPASELGIVGHERDTSRNLVLTRKTVGIIRPSRGSRYCEKIFTYATNWYVIRTGGTEGLWVQRGVELIEEFGVVRQSALQDFGLLFGGGPVLFLDGFGQAG
jgi:hypothetical protein